MVRFIVDGVRKSVIKSIASGTDSALEHLHCFVSFVL